MRGCWKPRCRSGVRKAGLAIPEIAGARADRSGSTGTSLGRSRQEAPLIPWPMATAHTCPGTPISMAWGEQFHPDSLPVFRGAKWEWGKVGRATQECAAPPGAQRSAGEGTAHKKSGRFQSLGFVVVMETHRLSATHSGKERGDARLWSVSHRGSHFPVLEVPRLFRGVQGQRGCCVLQG